MNYDYIIVGQGLAGTFLHYELSKQGQKVLCIDNSHNKSSSLVAAGLYNPIVFKRLSKSWNTETLLPFLNNFYTELESFLKEDCHQKIDILRIFSSIEEQNNWHAKIKDENYNKYLSLETEKTVDENKIPTPFGYGKIKQSGRVNLRVLLSSYRQKLITDKLIVNEVFEHDKLNLLESVVQYKSFQAKKIIFCEGYQVSINPFFNYLPLKQTNGEVLEISATDLHSNMVLNKGFFMCPNGSNKFIVGATYHWDVRITDITEQGKQELQYKIKNLKSDLEYKINNQKAGARPTVKDRRPLIGIHPKYNQLAIFNGMGTKGVMIAPYYANQFTNFLLNKNNPIDKEVDVNRFDLFSSF